MTSPTPRKYDLILFGATGYTGKLCAEHITRKLPTNIKWAVAGRSGSKLSAIVDDIKPFNPERRQPGIEPAALNPEDMDNLAKKTRVLINTVGPYFLYGSPVVEACVKNGTHYLDITGEVPWVLEMIKKHHETAKANKTIIIPEIGIESAPSDLIVWLLAKVIRDEFSVGTKEVISCLYDMKAAPSGGTLTTLLGLADHYSLKEIDNSVKPWALSPVKGPKPETPASWVGKIFGFRSVPQLGILTTSLFAAANTAIVQRSWALLDGGRLYGPKFTFQEYTKVRNRAFGAGVHLAMGLLYLVMATPLLRWIAKRFVYEPGQGRSKESTRNELIEYRAIATADQDSHSRKRALARFRYDGGMYYLSGLLLAEAAMVILQNNDLTDKLGGGVLTPAMLGQPFIDRLRRAGVTIEAETVPDQYRD